jgi:hypothetical protein
MIFFPVIQNFIISQAESKNDNMRGIFILVVCLTLISCNHEKKNQVNPVDSADIALRKMFPNDTIETIFIIKDEAQLKDLYGKKNVTTDTVWSIDGSYYLGTKLYSNTPDELIINWTDTARHAKVASIVQSCSYDNSSERYLTDTRWHTRTGVHIGTSLKELVDLNGNDFMFYGLGWDYGGDITDWKSGNLDNMHLFIKLGVDQMTDEQGKQYLKILGYKEYSSENPAAVKLDPFVVEIVLSRK